MGQFAVVTQTGELNTSDVTQYTGAAGAWAGVRQVGFDNDVIVAQVGDTTEAGIVQDGDLNVASVGQNGDADGATAYIDQYGDSSNASVTQHGDNAAEIVQYGPEGMVWGGHEANVIQSGDGSFAQITQDDGGVSTSGNTANVYSYGDDQQAYVDQSGARNGTTVEQTATADGSLAIVNQIGGWNLAMVNTAAAGSIVDISQAGEPLGMNYASANQSVDATGGEILVSQNGNGDGHYAFIAQREAGSQYAEVTQIGEDSQNYALILQSGAEARAEVSQSAEGNTADIDQTGLLSFASVVQTGIDNQSIIDQGGDNNSATTLQAGVGNLSTITQTGSFNTAIVNQ
ncbi:MAG: hypothetical protein EON55_07870 [Alphaproteobacteria bacterium]|nr:MAG: hypothetical protein EON55_07870 [Alphaproteobacteria bacterium]